MTDPTRCWDPDAMSDDHSVYTGAVAITICPTTRQRDNHAAIGSYKP